MQSENFDKKVRDSLSQRPPGNDKPAWDKMEPLLDKHLPLEKKDRRRVFFILFAFLLLGGGAFIIWQNNRDNKNNISSIGSQENNSSSEKTIKNTDGNPTAGTNTTKESDSEVTPGDGTRAPGTISQKKEGEIGDKSVSSIPASPEFSITRPNKTKKNRPVNDPVSSNSNPIEQKQIKQAETTPDVTKQNVTTQQPATTITNNPEQVKQPDTQKSSVENKNAEQKVETKESQPIATAKTNTQKQKTKRSFLDNVLFSVSAGADLSTIGTDIAGSVRPIVGAGIGYQVSNRFSIRTGFYTAHKVYEAGPDEYHPPYNLLAYYPNLKEIDANCKVYEIPLTIDYTFSNNKRHSWFASAGMSSLIMKEEVYDYYYKPNTSPNYITYRRTIKDKNKHYFSVLSVSGGYKREINKNFSLQAEPYLKIATHGVGFGKVKLNSGGVLVSAVIKPFAKKR